jgi:hypothetical protein
MGILRRLILPAGFAAGVVLAPAGCAREDSPSEQDLSPAAPQIRTQVHGDAAPGVAPSPSVQAKQPGQDREQFRQALTRRFDAKRMLKQQVLPDGTILYAPNGRVAHAVVGVRNADGTLGKHCISSEAELSALMTEPGAGAEQ